MCKRTFNKWLCGCETLASANLEHCWQYSMCAGITERRYVHKHVYCPTHALASRLRDRAIVPRGVIDRQVAFDFRKDAAKGSEAGVDHNLKPIGRSYAYREQRPNVPPNALPTPERTRALAERLAREERAPGNIVPGGILKGGRQEVSGGGQRQQTLPSVATVLPEFANRESTIQRKQGQGDSATLQPLKNAVNAERQDSEQTKMKERNDNRQSTASLDQQWHRWLMLRTPPGERGMLTVPVRVPHDLHVQLEKFRLRAGMQERHNLQQTTINLHRSNQEALILGLAGPKLDANPLYRPEQHSMPSTPSSTRNSSLTSLPDSAVGSSKTKPTSSEPILRRSVPRPPQASWVDREGRLFVPQRPSRTLRRRGRSMAEIRDSFLDLSQQVLPLYPVEDPTPSTRQYAAGTPYSPAITITSADPDVHYHWRARTGTACTQKLKRDGESPPRRSSNTVLADLEADISTKEPPENECPAVEATRPRSKSLKFFDKLFHRRGKAIAEDEEKTEEAQQGPNSSSNVSGLKPKKLHKDMKVKKKSSFWRGIDLEEGDEE